MLPSRAISAENKLKHTNKSDHMQNCVYSEIQLIKRVTSYVMSLSHYDRALVGEGIINCPLLIVCLSVRPSVRLWRAST